MKSFWTIPLCKLFNIRLELHLSFVLLIAYATWVGWSDQGLFGAVWSFSLFLIIFSCVVLHEFGHSLTAQRFGIRVHRILLLPIGGMAQFGRIPREPVQELVITLAGPLVNFVIVALIYPFTGVRWDLLTGPLRFSLAEIFPFILLFNLVMGVFNLLPLFPMDGGRILRALLAMRFPYFKASRIAIYLSRPLAVVLGLLAALASSWILAALFAFIFIGASIEYEILKRERACKDLTIRDVMRQNFYTADLNQTVGDVLEEFQGRRMPEDILVFDRGEGVGILPREALEKLQDMGAQHFTLSRAPLKRVSPLLSHWPLAPYADEIFRSRRKIIPVLLNNSVIGVVDAPHLRRVLRRF